MDAIFARLNLRARVALCGLISGYNDDRAGARPAQLRQPADPARPPARASSSSTTSTACPRRSSEIAEWIAEGKLTPLETVVEGFEELPDAINMLFDGANVGKLVVKIA